MIQDKSDVDVRGSVRALIFEIPFDIDEVFRTIDRLYKNGDTRVIRDVWDFLRKRAGIIEDNVLKQFPA